MSLRMIEIYHSQGKAEEIAFLLEDSSFLQMWHDTIQQGEAITKILLEAKEIDPVLEILQNFFASDQALRIIILEVEATIPRPEPTEEEKEEAKEENTKNRDRISVEELYQKMTANTGVSQKYLIMAGIAAFVAAIGLLKNDVAVIIGSMVIAPLLSPNMALALATTLADAALAVKAIRTNLVGVSLVLAIAFFIGFVLPVDPTLPEITSRSSVSHFYIFLALAAGVAGAYSMATGVAQALVGVMVAVALLPPLVTAGLLFGGGFSQPAEGALILFFVNVVSINLSGVVTFSLQGIQPAKWWEARKAKRAVPIAIGIWFFFLLLLALLIYLEQHKGLG